MWFGIGALLGLGPLLVFFDRAISCWRNGTMAIIANEYWEASSRYLDGHGTMFDRASVCKWLLDAFFYRKVVVVPWRLVCI